MHLGCVPDHHLLALHLWSTDGLNAKEFALLRSIVAACAPSRLLVVGLSPQLRALAAVNSGQGAATASDSAEDAQGVLVGRGPSSSAAVHVSRYPDPAGEAWAVLRRARSSPVCRRPTGTVRKLGCRLVLTYLPREVLDARWDVVVVDGPSGAGPGEPGRMGAIYTTAARVTGGEAVDMTVHEMNRTKGRSDATANLLHPAAPWMPTDERLIAVAGRRGQGSSGAGMETHLQGGRGRRRRRRGREGQRRRGEPDGRRVRRREPRRSRPPFDLLCSAAQLTRVSMMATMMFDRHGSAVSQISLLIGVPLLSRWLRR
ncbi:probable methyltransferase At1g27930 [Triticum aestivum]|uniref:probable methyltransferase At1g27930 n=1 Tax=Triticum aestivum TaxID=4565 RepID=UPI001D024032|nr:probable methyltransferase At1g27930 [Triticum aestivum]